MKIVSRRTDAQRLDTVQPELSGYWSYQFLEEFPSEFFGCYYFTRCYLRHCSASVPENRKQDPRKDNSTGLIHCIKKIAPRCTEAQRLDNPFRKRGLMSPKNVMPVPSSEVLEEISSELFRFCDYHE